MLTHILWSPEEGQCTQCGLDHIYVRRCTAGNAHTKFCKACWDDFIQECNVSCGAWIGYVSRNWTSEVNLHLEFEGDDGTAQRARVWN